MCYNLKHVIPPAVISGKFIIINSFSGRHLHITQVSPSLGSCRGNTNTTLTTLHPPHTIPHPCTVMKISSPNTRTKLSPNITTQSLLPLNFLFEENSSLI